ncbi:hypothetical protein JRQ81_011557 [Phrynocephalus forsythii]|uniref:MROH2B-like HEAT-repeats domain-containing protein n=1 Tax=Phrynocephalus forsythii TaxID=171643 RepID=A0A9Q0X648_9SAUR|nr:hypothetical protein JRQ81_011557 [Phrynocephalus forsythii]
MTSGDSWARSLHFASYFVEAGAKMLSRVRVLFSKKERGVGELERGCCPFWRRLPCFRRKIHPAPPSFAGSSTETQGLLAVTTNTSYSTWVSDVMRCSLSTSMDSSLGSVNVPSDQGWVIDWFMTKRRRRQQVRSEQDILCFLLDIVTCCKDVQDSGEANLGVPYSKTQLVAAVLDVMEELDQHQNPAKLLSWIIGALYNLSRIKPSTPREIETRLLDLALQAVINLEEPEDDPDGQALFKSIRASLQDLLQGLWEEEPNITHLLSILDHLRVWLCSPKDQERAWAMETVAAFLRSATSLPDCHLSKQLLQLRRLLAAIGICVRDANEEVSRNARESLRHLCPLLPSRKGKETLERQGTKSVAYMSYLEDQFCQAAYYTAGMEEDAHTWTQISCCQEGQCNSGSYPEKEAHDTNKLDHFN